jgi:hypothetical protein
MTAPSTPTDETLQQFITQVDLRLQEAAVRLPPRPDKSAQNEARDRVEDEPFWTFRQVESILADCYNIASSKRTTFASRLKNFHRLGFPLHFKAEQGKVARYSAGHLAMMALALDMTNLGLTPERIVRVLTLNWFPTNMALRMAAQALIAAPAGFDEHVAKPDEDPLSMFLFFDPSALSPLTMDYDPAITPDLDDAADSFFYGGQGVVRDNLVKWTSGYVSRISIINVTAMLDRLAGLDRDADTSTSALMKHTEERLRTFRAIVQWADDFDELFELGAEDAKLAYLETYFNYCVSRDDFTPERIDHVTRDVEDVTGMEAGFIRRALKDFIKDRETRRVGS